MAVIDVVTFNGEQDLFDLRYQILKDYVDEFIVIEFDKTFSGKDKPFYGEDFIMNYAKGKPLIRYCKVTDNIWHKYMELAKSSPNTVGASHWLEEFCQKEYIKDCLTHLKDTDIVYIGDVDEIVDMEKLSPMGKHSGGIQKIKLRVYTYFLNNRSSEEFWGTIRGRYKDIKNICLNHARSTRHYKIPNLYGWHFTSMGGPEALKKKLTDSYTEESYATPYVLNRVDTGYGRQDFLGRSFAYVVDESNWPQYLKDHKDQWKHLLA